MSGKLKYKGQDIVIRIQTMESEIQDVGGFQNPESTVRSREHDKVQHRGNQTGWLTDHKSGNWCFAELVFQNWTDYLNYSANSNFTPLGHGRRIEWFYGSKGIKVEYRQYILRRFNERECNFLTFKQVNKYYSPK